MGFVMEEVGVLDWRDWRCATTMDGANQREQDRYLAIQSLCDEAPRSRFGEFTSVAILDGFCVPRRAGELSQVLAARPSDAWFH